MAPPSLFPSSFQVTVLSFFLIIFSSASASSSSSSSSSPPPRPFKKIYAFGDSYTDTGNTRSLSGPSGFAHVSNPPYGMTFFHHPTNRYSDGRLVIDFVAEALSLPYLPPYLHVGDSVTTDHGVNFAVGGSTAIKHAFFVKNNLSLDMTPSSIQSQLGWLDKMLDSKGCKGSVSSSPRCKEVLDDALIWVGQIGVNDYAYILGSNITSDTIRKLAISSVTQSLKAILNRGVKYMVVQGFPLTGCLTLSMSLAAEDDRDELGCVKSVNDQSRAHNTIYQAKLAELRKQFPEATIVYLDQWNAYRAIVTDPKKYGFMEVFKVCCGSGDPPYNFYVFAACGSPSTKACSNPSQYINWDGVHLTEGMYKVLSDMFLKGGFSDPPFSELVSKKLRGG